MLESKEELKSRPRRFQDKGDAVALAFHKPSKKGCSPGVRPQINIQVIWTLLFIPSSLIILYAYALVLYRPLEVDLSSGLVYYPRDPQVFLEGRIIRKNFFFFGGMQLTEQNLRYYFGVGYRLFGF